ncbi:hypothetical protein GGI07_004720 [Coemansia sp. Benny D115]|nr:hypothetical protein GGI07_004720 [Coemansia sp. Benny D115]
MSDHEAPSDPHTPGTPAQTPPEEPGLPLSELADTAQVIGASVQAMQQVLLGNLQQAAQMTLSMNQMMEELVKRAIRTTVIAKHSPKQQNHYGCQLLVAITNHSPVPLAEPSVQLRLSCRHNSDGAVDAIAKVDTERNELGFVDSHGAMMDKEQPFVVTAQRHKPLMPGQRAESQLLLQLARPLQVPGSIELSFVSPGTGRPLVVSHRFGIQCMQLLPHRTVLAAGKQNDSLVPLEGQDVFAVDLVRVRELFALPPARGIATDDVLVLAASPLPVDKQDGDIEPLLALQVCAVSPNMCCATCRWLCRPDPTDDTQALAPTLADELAASMCCKSTDAAIAV